VKKTRVKSAHISFGAHVKRPQGPSELKEDSRKYGRVSVRALGGGGKEGRVKPKKKKYVG